MKTKLFFFIFLSVLLATGCSQSPNIDSNLNFNLNFEDIQDGKPDGWYIYSQKAYLVSLDSETVESGRYSLAIEYNGDSAAYFQPVMLFIPNKYEGSRITLSGYIKTENVDGYAGLWMRIDPQDRFADMEKDKIDGTTDWKKYQITLALNPGTQIVVGGLLAGVGKMWLDDLQITIDGKDISLAKTKN